jgi:cell division protein FtsN
VESPVAPPVTASTPFFRVRLGRFSSRDEADRLRSEVERTGVGEVTIVRDGDAFAVQAGAYRARENAERVAAELRSRSFQPEVSQGTPSPAGRP